MAVTATAVERQLAALGRGRRAQPRAMVFLVPLWPVCSSPLFLFVLLVTTLLDGARRLDLRLLTEYPASSPSRPERERPSLGRSGDRDDGAVLAIPLGVAAAITWRSSPTKHWSTRFIELNIQNLAASPRWYLRAVTLGC